jgi:hypothetical protein
LYLHLSNMSDLILRQFKNALSPQPITFLFINRFQ